jgi:glutamine synthetase
MAPLTLEQLTAAADAGEIDTVILAQVDMQGRMMGKRLHVRHFLESGYKESHSCNYLLAADLEMEPVPGFETTSWERGYGDYTMRPDLETLRLAPWLPGTALVLADILDHHGMAPVSVSPRAILQQQVERLATLGLSAKMASELEFFLFKESFEDAESAGYRSLTPISPYNEDYHIFQTTKEEGVLRAIRNGLYGAGIPVESTKGEAAAGQGELNIRYGAPIETADYHTIAKNAAKEIAWSQGRALTFMAKWNYAASGSSCHVHQSLWSADGSVPLFHDANGPYGMSKMMQHFLAGQLLHASEFTFFLAPNINSYKRFQAQTFAPTKAVWSSDNRTAGYRICGADSPAVRVECRVGGADLNPYLAFAALLAAGIAGIEAKLELEPEAAGDAYAETGGRAIPPTLRAATTALQGSSMLRTALGDDVVDHYVHAAEWEQIEYDRRVTDWEIARGFERS